jgi:hypothetical protein
VAFIKPSPGTGKYAFPTFLGFAIVTRWDRWPAIRTCNDYRIAGFGSDVNPLTILDSPFLPVFPTNAAGSTRIRH